MGTYRPHTTLIFALLAAGPALAQNYAIATVAGGALPASGMAAAKASIGDPPRVAVDPAGNVYFGSLHAVFQVDTSGALIRIAGTGRAGYSGDGGPALTAQLRSPAGIAADASGNVFVADPDTHSVRKILPDGTITTYAGNGTAGYSGDGGPAATAQLNTPDGLVLDSVGNLYIADRNNHSVRVISLDGNIHTVAGRGSPGFSGDGGAAANAQLNSPEGISLDSAGNLYIADTVNDRIRMVAPDGTITTVAGTGNGNVFGDGGPALAAGLILPTGVAVDRAGNFYIADFGNSRIRVVSAGKIATVAGSRGGAPLADQENALSVVLNGPTGVAVDVSGNLYFTEGSIGSGSGLAQGDNRVWKVSPDSILTALAGTGMASYSGDGGSAASAQLQGPTGVATDARGNVYVADTGNHRVRLITTDGVIRTIAGTGEPGFSGDGGAAASAQLNSPTGVALDPSGELVIADSGNSRVRVISTDGTIRTLIGNGNSSYYGDGLSDLQASLNHPQGVVVSRNGDIFIADTRNNAIRKRGANGLMSTVAGTGPAGFSGDGGPATSALLNAPTGVAVDGAGNVYLVDAGNQRVRRVAANGVINTVAGSLANPRSVATDASGNIFVTSGGDRRVLLISVDGTPSPIAGTGDCCYSGDGGPAVNAALDGPWGLAVDASSGNVYVADAASSAVRALIPAGAVPNLTSVVNGASNLNAPIAPGEVVVLYGSGLGPNQLALGQPVSGQYPTELAGTTVLFNDTPGFLVYASAMQVGAIVPTTISSASMVQVAVQYRDLVTPPVTLPAAAASPGVFTLDGSGKGQAAATNSDGSVNSAGHPAAGSITLYVTGIAPASSVQVTLGAVNATAVMLEAAPGISRATVQLPAGVQGSTVPVVLRVNGVSSQDGVTVAISVN
jgi:uncharacterized protein (TIGR03437 family)